MNSAEDRLEPDPVEYLTRNVGGVVGCVVVKGGYCSETGCNECCMRE